MKKTLIATALTCSVVGALAQRAGWELVDVTVTYPGQTEALRERGVDVWESEANRFLVYASPEDRKFLNEAGIDWQPHAKTIESYVAKGLTDFPTFNQYVQQMNDWAEQYPEIVTLESIGQSIEARDIWMLKISDNPGTDEDEPETLLISLQHAREWLAGATLHGITDHILTNYGSDDRVTAIVDNSELYIILVANPDGYVYTHEVDRTWRKNRRNNGNGTFGVDLNRNFDWLWSSGNQNTNSFDYRGESPNSEPETQALIDWIEDHRGGLAACLNYHTYGQLVMYNWAYSFEDPPNVEMMRPVADRYAEDIRAVNGRNFDSGSWAQVLNYTGYGTTNDYLHAALGVPTITFELYPDNASQGAFYVDESAIAPSIAENVPAALNFLEWVIEVRGDETPAIISPIEVAIQSNTSALLLFKTDEPSDVTILYGETEELGEEFQEHRLRDINHAIQLNNLTPGATYHARVRAENLAGRISESDMVQFTLSQSLPAPPELLSFLPQLPGIEVGIADAAGDELLIEHRTLDGGWQEGVPIEAELNQVQTVSARRVINGLRSNRSDVYAGRRSSGPRVLLVDGFDRWDGSAASNGLNHAFLADHAAALRNIRCTIESVSNEMLLLNPQFITNYDAIIWMSGDESTADETFSSEEQELISTYLESGGKLFVTGSEIGWDIGRAGFSSPDDISFYTTYLAADFRADDLNSYEFEGTAGGPFEGISIRIDDGFNGAYDVAFPDEVNPQSGAQTVMQTAGNRSAGIAKTGLFGNGAEEAQLVYFGYPFETIVGVTERERVMTAVMDYFELNQPNPDGWLFF